MTAACRHRPAPMPHVVDIDTVDEDTMSRHGWVIQSTRCVACDAELVRVEHHGYLWPDNGPSPALLQDTTWTVLSEPRAFTS